MSEATVDGIDDAGTGGDDEGSTGPPAAVLGFAGASVVAGAALLLTSALALHVLGYVLASLVTIVLVGIFRRVDLRLRLSRGYRPRAGHSRVIPVLLVGAFLVTAGHVWAIATELAS